MNRTKIFITTMLVASLAAGCSKEDTNGDSTRDNVMRIFAGSFQNDSKVTYNPGAVNAVNWVEGEYMSLNCGSEGNDYAISEYEGGTNQYCINFGTGYPFTGNGTIYALYPAQGTPDIDVDVTNTATSHVIVLNNLVIKGTSDNSEMAFPMAASGNYEGQGSDFPALTFKHLCAGFRVQLTNVMTAPTSLRIVALCDNTVQNQSIVLDGKTVTASWGKQGYGPVLPTGSVGSNTQDVTVGNYSEMNFTVDASAINTAEHKMDFCIPVTTTKIRSLVIVGYNGEEVLFKKTTRFAEEKTLAVNTMYTLPAINL